MKSLPSVEEARARMLAAVSALQSEAIPLTQARGRILAQDVTSWRDQPPFAASAMDGYAVRNADLPATLTLIGESHAGAGFKGAVGPGQCVRILTGAPLPDGADRVVIQEDVERDGDAIRAPAPEGGDNIRPRGVDFKADQLLVPKGSRIDAVALALAAATGAAELAVMRKPRVAVFATGDELAQLGATPGPDQIFDSGGPGITALCESWGANAFNVRAAEDDVDVIAQAARDAMENADILVVIGGASVGDRDLAKPAFQKLGLELLVDKVAVRPGKPVWFGKTTQGLVLGLPGNPASGLVCAHLFLRPVLNAMRGMPPGPPMQRARLRSAVAANGPREHYLRSGFELDAQGQAWATPFEAQDSSLLSVFSKAKCLVRLMPKAEAMAEGDLAEILPLDRDFG
ncbi:MAG: gephyrin-like molybdotransferase Glp [Caulobacterales bacterium]